MRLAQRILGSVDDAQDVHQDVFLAILKRWHKYDGKTRWDGYLYRVTIRKAIACARKSRNIRQNQDEYEQNLSRIKQSPRSGTKQQPDERLRAEELQAMLRNAITKLPKKQAQVFTLARLEGLKYPEIAEITGCSEQTVRVHLHRALKKLADSLSDYIRDDYISKTAGRNNGYNDRKEQVQE